MSAPAKVTSIDSPDIRWKNMGAEQKLAIARRIRSDKNVSDGDFRVYSVFFDKGWKHRRARLSLAEIGKEAGMPRDTARRHVANLCKAGHLGKRRLKYVNEWVLDPTEAELECAELRTESEQNCALSTPPLNKERARQSSSTNEKTSEASVVQTSFADDDEKPKTPAKPKTFPPESPKATPVPMDDATGGTRNEFLEWFNEHYRERLGEIGCVSRKVLVSIERQMAAHGFGWHWFTLECRKHCSKTAKNPIGLVIDLAKKFADYTFPPKVTAIRPPQESKPCQTCKSRAGLLPDRTPCPDCPLGRDLKVQQDINERKYGKGKRSPGGQL